MRPGQSGDVVAAQRDAAIKQLAQAVAAERTEVTRCATTQAVASERETIVAAWNASLQSQRQALVSDVETASSRAVNRISILAGLVVSLGILLTALAVLIVRRIARSRQGRAPTSPARVHRRNRSDGGRDSELRDRDDRVIASAGRHWTKVPY